MHRAGFAVLVGQPNVGKSTLINALLEEKIAIVSRRPQTTRTRILGVFQGADAQIAFVDTPGIHSPKNDPLAKKMVATALSAIEEVDLCILVADLRLTGNSARSKGQLEEDKKIISRLAKTHKPTILLLNKMDAVSREKILEVIEIYKDIHDFSFIYPLSALKGVGIKELPDLISPLLPESSPLFPADVLTDQAERVLAAEYIREQVFHFTHAEIPYGIAVEVRQFDESARSGHTGGLIRIHADIIVERASPKGIIIGSRGAMLKRIGTAARRELEKLLGAKIWLGLHVRVEKDWTKNPAGLKRFE